MKVAHCICRRYNNLLVQPRWGVIAVGPYHMEQNIIPKLGMTFVAEDCGRLQLKVIE